MESLVDRYKYKANYIPDYPKFLETVMNKTVIPYQIEMQPGPEKGNICWLKCPYCYGGSAMDTGERMDARRWEEVLHEAAEGGVKKVIFAGYCTDPLNYEHIEDLLEIAIKRGMVFGFNTKALRVSKRLVKLLDDGDVMPSSYLNVGVDAGYNESYNRVHGVKEGARLYERVLENTRDVADSFRIDVSASYLILGVNNSAEEIRKFVEDFKMAGCKLIRFTFPQPPKGREFEAPNDRQCVGYLEKLSPIIKELDTPECRVIFVDADREHDIFHKARTLPCLARWVFPTVGFDGWLYHCSQSAAPNFGKMALGNLQYKGFWNTFYDYNLHSMTEDEKMMVKLGCRCDRKEHVLNSKAINNP